MTSKKIDKKKCRDLIHAGVRVLKYGGFDIFNGRVALWEFEEALKYDPENQEALWWTGFLSLVFYDNKPPHKNYEALKYFLQILDLSNNPDKGLWKTLSRIILDMVQRRKYGDFVDRIDPKCGKLLLAKYKFNVKI